MVWDIFSRRRSDQLGRRSIGQADDGLGSATRARGIGLARFPAGIRVLRAAVFLSVAATLFAIGNAAGAAEKLRVGKAIQNAFTFGLLDVGIANGVFRQAGLDVEPVTFSGAPKLQQAMTSNDIDLGLSTVSVVLKPRF